MKVRCVANTGKSLSQKNLDLGYKKESKFNVEIESEYIVYSMMRWGETLDYLIIGEKSEVPSWYPVELFEVVNHLLPPVYYFIFSKYKNYKGKESQLAIWGYKEMTTSLDHYIALTEENTRALEIFFKRKCQIDEFEELSQFRFKK